MDEMSGQKREKCSTQNRFTCFVYSEELSAILFLRLPQVGPEAHSLRTSNPGSSTLMRATSPFHGITEDFLKHPRSQSQKKNPGAFLVLRKALSRKMSLDDFVFFLWLYSVNIG